MPIRNYNEPLGSNSRQRAVSYARVSTKEQELGYSIQAEQELHHSYERGKTC
jgi:hypothetical protein